MKALQAYESHPAAQHFNPKQIEILKNSICKGVSTEEFEIFLMACHKTQLDPFMRQIYAVKRKAKKPDGSWGDVMTIQTGIDGYRLIAERTGCYAPGPEPTYVYDENKHLVSATSYIKKLTRDGTWHTVSASAYMAEYCQKTREGQPMGMWSNMPLTMLAKCAEAQALRKAFPAEMSGIYTKEEMQQADVVEITKISLDQAHDLDVVLDECDPKYKAWVFDCLKKTYGVHHLVDMPSDIYDRVKSGALKNMELYQQKKIEVKE
jgi:phage recombination protein Bet